MEVNPYQATVVEPSVGSPQSPVRNWIGEVGFTLSGFSLTGLGLGTFWPLLYYGAFLSLPGIVLCLIAFRQKPRRLAVWGLCFGVFVGMYVPTLSRSLLLTT